MTPLEFSFEYLLNIVYPIGLLIIGYIAGKTVGLIVRFFLYNVIGLDKWLEMKQIKIFEKGASSLLSNIAKWYIYLFFIGEALISTKVKFLEDIGNSLLNFIPKLFIGILIFVAGFIILEALQKEIISNLEIQEKYKSVISKIIRFIGAYVLLVIALNQIGIDTTILIYLFIILFASIVLSFSIAIGIAFGFALKDKASEIIEKFFK